MKLNITELLLHVLLACVVLRSVNLLGVTASQSPVPLVPHLTRSADSVTLPVHTLPVHHTTCSRQGMAVYEAPDKMDDEVAEITMVKC